MEEVFNKRVVTFLRQHFIYICAAFWDNLKVILNSFCKCQVNDVFNFSVIFKHSTCAILLQRIHAKFIQGNSIRLLTMAELANMRSIPTLKIKECIPRFLNFDK